eukprot:2644672-Pleurochrysis_carterae.AAC.3
MPTSAASFITHKLRQSMLKTAALNTGRAPDLPKSAGACHKRFGASGGAWILEAAASTQQIFCCCAVRLVASMYPCTQSAQMLVAVFWSDELRDQALRRYDANGKQVRSVLFHPLPTGQGPKRGHGGDRNARPAATDPVRFHQVE